MEGLTYDELPTCFSCLKNKGTFRYANNWVCGECLSKYIFEQNKRKEEELKRVVEEIG